MKMLNGLNWKITDGEFTSAELLKDGKVVTDFEQDRQALAEYLNRPIPWGTAEYPVRPDGTVRIKMASWDTLDYRPEQLPTVGHLLGAIYTYFNLSPLSEKELRRIIEPQYLDALLRQIQQGKPVTRIQVDADHVFFEGFNAGSPSEDEHRGGYYYIMLGS